MTDTDTIVQTSPPQEKLDEGDHDRFSHYVIGGSEAILKAMVSGEPCTALCGKVWVPNADPDRFPICPTCEAEKERLQL